MVLEGAKPCKFYDWSQDRIVEGPDTAGCQAAVVSTPCTSTQLYSPGGSEVIPDQCFGKKGENHTLHFTPPCPASSQGASARVKIECTVTRRRAVCKTDGGPCKPGKWVRSAVPAPCPAARRGSAANVQHGRVSASASRLACTCAMTPRAAQSCLGCSVSVPVHSSARVQ